MDCRCTESLVFSIFWANGVAENNGQIASLTDDSGRLKLVIGPKIAMQEADEDHLNLVLDQLINGRADARFVERRYHCSVSRQALLHLKPSLSWDQRWRFFEKQVVQVSPKM